MFPFFIVITARFPKYHTFFLPKDWNSFFMRQCRHFKVYPLPLSQPPNHLQVFRRGRSTFLFPPLFQTPLNCLLIFRLACSWWDCCYRASVSKNGRVWLNDFKNPFRRNVKCPYRAGFIEQSDLMPVSTWILRMYQLGRWFAKLVPVCT